MEIKEYVHKKKEIYNALLSFIDDEDDRFTNFSQMLHQISESKDELHSFLHLVVKLSKNHRRLSHFFKKIEQIILFFKNDIIKFFSNIEIFNIFENNKRILLLIIQNKIITIDQQISELIMKKNDSQYIEYHQYFYPEIKFFIDKKRRKTIEKELIKDNPDFFTNFEKNRLIGENDSFICSLIRQDSVEEFISFMNRNNISLSSHIKPSIFETNSFLIENEKPTLIEYSAFYGSIQIFQYLKFNNVELSSSLWLYAIHSNNAELIHLLEENEVEPKDKSYEKCFKESIKCHHNEVARYIKENLLDEKVEINNLENEYNKNEYAYSFAYYNFAFIPDDLYNNNFVFHYLCHYNYIDLVKLYAKNKSDFNVNLKSNQIPFSALKIASQRNNMEISYFLLSQPGIEIESKTFERNNNLIEITISNSVSKIGEEAFSQCKSLAKVTFQSSSILTIFNKGLFIQCLKLKEIKIPSSVTSIGSNCFKDCSSLKKVSFENESLLTEINENAFCGCSSLEKIALPSSLKKIHWYAFDGCSSLKQISIPISISYIGDFAFKDCMSIKNIKILGSNVSIGFDIFKGCTSLEEIMIPLSAMSSIGNFQGNVIIL